MPASKGYETTAGDGGKTLYRIGDSWVDADEAREYAQAEADALYAAGDPDAYAGYPAEIAPEPQYPEPGSKIPPKENGGQDGYRVGECGHRVAESEWRAGFRKCERC